MARASQVKNYYTFVKGLVTEASPLTFPEEASLDEDNCVLKLDGSRPRRKGLSRQAILGPHSNSPTHIRDTHAFTTFNWTAANNDSENSFVVVQVGQSLYFFRQDSDELADGFYGLSTTDTEDTNAEGIDLFGARSDGSITSAEVNATRVSMASGTGKLFVVGKTIDPIVVTYDPVADAFSYKKTQIRTRDTEGADYPEGDIDYNVQIDTGPTSLSPTHAYNLINQGWPEDAIETFRSEQNRYPSNSEMYHLGIIIQGGNDTQSFNSDEVVALRFGNTLAPRGYFLRNIFDTTQTFDLSSITVPTTVIYDEVEETLTFTTDSPHGVEAGSGTIITFNNTVITYDVDDVGGESSENLDGDSFTEGTNLVVIDPSTFQIDQALANYNSNEHLDPAGSITIGTISNPDGQSTDNRPEAVAFFAGRVWYAGVAADYLSGKILFSRIIENERHVGHCYQGADPTSGQLNELVDTDGGVLSIPEMGKVLTFSVVGSSLIIIADNGVWEVSGGGSGFTATNFSIREVMKSQIRSKNSIVSIDGAPVFWTDDGIYTLSQDDISGFLTARNISAQSIQSLFEEIPLVAHESVQPIYNPLTKTIGWLYSDSTTRTSGGLASPVLNKALFLDFRLEAFSQYSWDVSDWYVAGAAIVDETSDKEKKIQFFSIRQVDSADFTWSSFTDGAFLDWGDKDYTSFLETGHETLGDTIRKKQATYLEAYFSRTEDGFEEDENGNIAFTNPSSCLLTVKWGWSDSANSGRQHGPYQIYRFRRNYIPTDVNDSFDYGFEVVHTRSKVRGKGRSVRFRFESETGKDFHLLGWSVPYTSTGEA